MLAVPAPSTVVGREGDLEMPPLDESAGGRMTPPRALDTPARCLGLVGSWERLVG